MKKTLFFASLMMAAQLNFAQDWKPAGAHILTPWGEKVTAQKPHPEYPRPQLTRTNNWQNLNGLWKYAVTPVGTKEIPRQWDGNILLLLNRHCLVLVKRSEKIKPYGIIIP